MQRLVGSVERAAVSPLISMEHSSVQSAYATTVADRPLLIAVPLFKRPDLARQIIQSLIKCAQDIIAVQGEVIFLNDSPDDAELSNVLQSLLPDLEAIFPSRLIVNAVNLGFVRSCNIVFKEATARGMDLLLLNSDVVVTPGALTEMARVSRLDPMIGFVNPRSNNATLATLPFQDRFRHLPVDQARPAWQTVAAYLPRLSYVPTAVGFCMLIRWSVMAEFGAFDEIYGVGYNEENDLVMRAGRRGYRAVLANHAYVWHEGQGSFALKPEVADMERNNRAILLARYPEYGSLTGVYFGSAEQRAEFLLGALIPDADGRVDVALDFSSFPPAHNGTTVAGVQLLAKAAIQWKRFNLYVLCSPAAYAFHDYGQYGVARRDAHGAELYAAIFRVGQPYDWGVMERLALKAATIGLFMLDTISIDSSQLYSPRLNSMWSFALEHADLVATTSELTSEQLDRRFSDGSAARLRSLHSLDLADYELPNTGATNKSEDGHLFVVGNHFWHKDVAAAVNALSQSSPERQIVVLAGGRDAPPPVDPGQYAPRGLDARPNVVRLQAGLLTQQQMGDLYGKASAIVFPSHYEGFGIPLLNALAAKRPVFIRPLPVFEEMERALGGDPNIYVFQTTEALVEALKNPPTWIEEGASKGLPGDAIRAANDVGGAIETMIQGANYNRIVRRIRAIQTLHDFANLKSDDEFATFMGDAEAAPETRAAFAARYLAQRVELLAQKLFKIRAVLATTRWVFRAAEAGRKAFRSRRLA